MRRLPFRLFLVALVCLPIALGTAHAGESGKDKAFQFGLESRFGEAIHGSAVDWGLIPTFSYRLTDRFRLDAFAGVGYSEQDGLFLGLTPGFRYYLGPPRGRVRFNTGLSVGFTVIDHDDPVTTTDALGNPVTETYDDDDVWLRLVPIEAEYWGRERWGLTLALDYTDRFGGDRSVRSDGFGLAAGFRVKIR